jgi:addiction module HigA family antidote
MKKLPPIIPGEILLEEYLKPMEISQNARARAIGVPPRAINEIVLGRRSITPTMSIRFGAFFSQTPYLTLFSEPKTPHHRTTLRTVFV